MISKIKFGTDGWRAIIADDYTVENVKRVAYATALWLKKAFENPSAVVGCDPRFAGPMFADVTACVLASQGVKVYRASNSFISTPNAVAIASIELILGLEIPLSIRPICLISNPVFSTKSSWVICLSFLISRIFAQTLSIKT